MDLIWKAIDGLVKPEKLLAHLTEQKVNLWSWVWLKSKIKNNLCLKSKLKHLESLVADIISIIGN